MSAGKRTREAAYDRTGYANVADKFVTCVQREGSHSITSDDCDNLLSLLAQCAALREALQIFIGAASAFSPALHGEDYKGLRDANAIARAALVLADGAK